MSETPGPGEVDEFGPYLAEQMQDPEFRAAHEAAEVDPTPHLVVPGPGESDLRGEVEHAERRIEWLTGVLVNVEEWAKAENARADAAVEQRTLAEQKVARVEALHTPFRIYDECEHNHTDEDVQAGRAVNISEVGYTCQEALLYVACRECCTTDDGYQDWQTEECATYHTHSKDGPICPTRAALADPEADR